MARDTRIQIFVSSPADVEHERAAVKDIIERLGREYLYYFQLHAVLWEEEALTADRTFQAGLTQPEDCDIVLVILWTRLGSPLPEEPYRGMTGTEWEFFNAVEASARGGTPEVLVYKKTAPKLVDITDAASAREAVDDRRRLDSFFRENFFNEDNTFRRAFRVFDNDAAFRELVETQLRKLLNRRISAERRASSGAGQWQGSPYRADRPFDIGDERVFTGREREIRELIKRLEERPPDRPGLLLLSGASGAGKTSLLRAGLIPRLTRPFLFEQVATVRAALVDPRDAGASPVAALAQRLSGDDVLGVPLAGFGVGSAELERLLRGDPPLAARQLASALRQIAADSDLNARLAVILDPLEPILDQDEVEVALFLRALRALSTHPSLWVIASVRADALPRLARHRALLLDPERPAAQQWLRLAPPAIGRIRQVIEIPARVAGIELDLGAPGEGRSTVERIESEAIAFADWVSPTQNLLQAAYRRAETSADADRPLRISIEQIAAEGGLRGVLLERADALWTELDADARAELPRLCRALIAVEGSKDGRFELRQGDLQTLRAHPACRRLTDALIQARLLIADGLHEPELLRRCSPVETSFAAGLLNAWREATDERRPKSHPDTAVTSPPDPATAVDAPSAERPALDPVPPIDGTEVEPASSKRHEAKDSAQAAWNEFRAVASFVHPVLITRWAPVAAWLRQAEHRRVLSLRTQLTLQTRLWKHTDCNREYLYQQQSYGSAHALAQAYPDELDAAEREFLAASGAQLKFNRRRNRVLRAFAVTLVALMLGAVAAAGTALHASRTARVNLHKSLLKEAELHIARGNTPQAVINAIDAGADLPEQAVRKLSLAFNGNRLLAMAPSAGPGPDAPRFPGLSAGGDLLATVTPEHGPVRWRLDGGRYVPDRDLQADGLGIHSLVFGDEEQILGVGEDGVWRLPAASQAGPLYDCGTVAGSAIRISPNRTRLAIALAAADGGHGVCVIDLELPGNILLKRRLDDGEIRGMGFSPDGRHLVTAAAGGRSHVFDLDRGRLLQSLPAEGPLGRPFNNAVFDATGERIAIAAVDERIRLYRLDGTPIGDLSRSRVGATEMKVHRSAIRDVAFAPLGDFLVAVDDEGQVVRWSLDGTEQAVVLGNHELSVSDVEIAPRPAAHLAGQHLVLTGSLDHTARLWSLESGRPVAVLGHDAAVAAVGFAADGARVSTYSLLDGTVRLWSVAAETRLGFQLDHPDHVWDLDVAAAPEPLAPDGDALLLATAGFDGGVRVWRYERQRAYPRPEPLQALQGHDNRARQVRFAPGGRLLSSAGYDGTAIVHDLVTEQACTLHVTDQERGEVYNALFGPGARWLLATSNDPEAPARLFSVPNCEPLSATSPLPHGEAPVQAAAVHHPPEDIARVQESDGADMAALILTGDDAGIIRLFRADGRGGWQKTCELAAEVGAVGAVALSPDAAYAAVAGGDSRTALLEIDPVGGQCTLHKHLVGHTGRVYSVRFGPDGKRILTASLDKTARVWTLDGASLAVLAGHQDRIYRADFSPDGDWILTASRDGSIRLWRAPAGVGAGGLFDGPEIKQEFLPLRANVGGVAAAAFSPDGHYLAGAYWENAAILWRIWRDGDEVPTALRRRWGPDRARLALISEAYRFRTDNALVDAATRSSDDAAP